MLRRDKAGETLGVLSEDGEGSPQFVGAILGFPKMGGSPHSWLSWIGKVKWIMGYP